MWQKLSNVQDRDTGLEDGVRRRSQVVSKIRSDHAARVLAILPDEFALDVVNRMLRMEAVPKDALERIEETLRVEFIANLSHTARREIRTS
jgi:flagellar motor switch protein FliG